MNTEKDELDLLADRIIQTMGDISQQMASLEKEEAETVKLPRDFLSPNLAAQLGINIENASFSELVYVNTARQRIRDLKENQEQLMSHLDSIKEVIRQIEQVHKSNKASSRQNIWLTIVSSLISLTIGWLLSLIGSPANLLMLFHH